MQMSTRNYYNSVASCHVYVCVSEQSTAGLPLDLRTPEMATAPLTHHGQDPQVRRASTADVSTTRHPQASVPTGGDYGGEEAFQQPGGPAAHSSLRAGNGSVRLSVRPQGEDPQRSLFRVFVVVSLTVILLVVLWHDLRHPDSCVHFFLQTVIVAIVFAAAAAAGCAVVGGMASVAYSDCLALM